MDDRRMFAIATEEDFRRFRVRALADGSLAILLADAIRRYAEGGCVNLMQHRQPRVDVQTAKPIFTCVDNTTFEAFRERAYLEGFLTIGEALTALVHCYSLRLEGALAKVGT